MRLRWLAAMICAALLASCGTVESTPDRREAESPAAVARTPTQSKVTPSPAPSASVPVSPAHAEPPDPRDPPISGFDRTLRAAMNNVRAEFEAAQVAETLSDAHSHARVALSLLAGSSGHIGVLPSVAQAPPDDDGPIGFPQGLGLLTFDEGRRSGNAAQLQYARDVLGNPEEWKADARGQYQLIQQAVVAGDWRKLRGSALRSAAIAQLMLASASLEQAKTLAAEGAREAASRI